jgi:F-type H+-transporting ATPase subunit b
MPAIFDPHFWDLANAELWVGVGLLIFFGILVAAGVPRLAAGALDAKAIKVRAELDEAQRLRAEAEALLAQIRAEKAEAERQAADMLAAAQAEAARLEADAKTQAEESLQRRQALAERRIAQAEAQATAEVKAAAVEQAALAAERILAARLASGGADPLVDAAIDQVAAGRLN